MLIKKRMLIKLSQYDEEAVILTNPSGIPFLYSERERSVRNIYYFLLFQKETWCVHDFKCTQIPIKYVTNLRVKISKMEEIEKILF